MHRILPLAGLCAMLLCAVPARAQQAPVLTLAQAIAAALEFDPALAGARHALSAMPALKSQAAAMPNPELSALREGGDTRTWTISQPLELGGKRPARMAAADAARAAAQAGLRVRAAEVRADVIAAYYDSAAAQAALASGRAGADLAARAVQVAERRVKAGKVSPVELARAQLAGSAAQLDVGRLESDLAEAQSRLRQLTGAVVPAPPAAGQPGCEAGPTAGPDAVQGIGGACAATATLPLPPAAATNLDARYANAPQPLKARADAAYLDALAAVERTRQSPDVTLTAGVKSEPDPRRRQHVIGVSLPLPLFDRNQGRLAEALAKAGAARAELAAMEVRGGEEVRLAAALLARRVREAELVRDSVLPAAQSAFDASAKGYEYGKFAILDVLDARRTVAISQSQYIQAVREAWRAWARVERILGPEE